MLEFIKQPWAWYVTGPLIAFIMTLLLYFGNNFGVSANLRTMCSISGGGKFSDFFRFNWRSQIWNIVFVFGTIIGGFISSTLLSNDTPIQLSSELISSLKSIGINEPEKNFLPKEIFSLEALFSLKGFIALVIGGFLVGFGSRYAGGCTSGHAISGLSDLQLPSLIAVIGFFIGGLIMTHFLLPIILNL